MPAARDDLGGLRPAWVTVGCDRGGLLTRLDGPPGRRSVRRWEDAAEHTAVPIGFCADPAAADRLFVE